MGKKNIRVIYLGLHPDTLIYIDKPPFKVITVSYLDFLAKSSFNPVSALFALSYILKARKWPKSIVQTIFFIWTCFKFLSEDFQIRYSSYLSHIIKNNVQIINGEDINIIEITIITDNIDMIIVNSWSILPEKIIDIPPLGIINVHPSKLPLYRGALPTLWALKNRDSTFAVSVIKLLPGIDNGPLLSQREFNIPQNANAINIENEINNALKKYLWTDLVEYVEKTTILVPQLGESSTTDKYMAYRQIKWKYEKAEDIMNKILLYPYIEPKLYAYTYIQGRRINFKNAKHEKMLPVMAPGEIIIKGYFLFIQTLVGSIKVRLFKDISFFDSLFIMINLKKINS